jgi:hypothetical protein
LHASAVRIPRSVPEQGYKTQKANLTSPLTTCSLRERERETETEKKEKGGGEVVRYTTFGEGARNYISVLQVPRQCPLVLLV